ncbi:putative oxidoreductase [Nitritalea halalkaliphila LW7]|uniref:Putative oxidoreductase n=1 Tax=Nitritalea halalkaliphila LW7 TaxID=1189621 RepID=I5C7B8_9BACT|nr:NADPH:quinone oxidoreductase family protein [Nitritalea halalkaliphila]EIM77720.1 putative oxidoreductase [Nitritalea halalkaliphila LW7]
MPGAGELLLEVRACSLNFPDLLMIADKYQVKPPLPFSPGGELAGRVRAVGPEVKGFRVGDRVLALSGWGGLAEMAIVPAARCIPLPAGLSDEVAAAALYTLGTCYHALKDRAALQPKERLFVLGAAGGIGMAAIQLGKLMGAEVIAAVGSAEKVEACLEAGADQAFVYEAERAREQFKTELGPKGADVVLDPVGGDFAEPAFRCMAWKGRYLVVGFAAGQIPSLPFNLTLLKGADLIGVFWGRFTQEQPQVHLENTRQLMQWLEEGRLAQRIHKRYSLQEGIQALQDLQARKVIGKAIVLP